MDAVTFNNKNKSNTSSTAPQSVSREPPTGTSPRLYDSEYLLNSDSAMSNNANGSTPQNTNFNSASYNNGIMNANKPREDSLTRPGRQDSMSFYTNFGNGPRFSTDSNSSFSNFLGFGGSDQVAFDPNARGMSIINNMFLPPSGTSVSSFPSSAPPGSTSSGPAPASGSSLIPPNDYSTGYGQFRRPSEQLEPFNPTVKLKMPSFSKRGSVTYPQGTSFSENPDFDFFNKRDSVRTRQPSFLNPNYNDNYLDFFTKRDSLKNFTEEDLLKEVSIPKAPGTRSEPDTNVPASTIESIPERPQTAMGGDNPQYMQMSQQYTQPPQVPYDVQQQQQQQHHQLPHHHQHHHHQQQHPQHQPLPPQSQSHPPPPSQRQQASPQGMIQSKIDTSAMPLGQVEPVMKYEQPPAKAKKRGTKKKQKVQASPPQFQQGTSPLTDSLPLRRNAIQPTYQKQEHSPVMNQTQLSPTASQYSNSSDKKPMTAHETALADDGRPLLGATKVDQLMLVIQARKKGIHKQIPQDSDGSVIDNENGVLPVEADLVGGIEKPKTKSTKPHRCEYCNKTFTQSTHLQVHVRSHIGLKPFGCEYCGKRFTQGGNLRTHLRLHTGEKPYRCETCGRDFSRKGNLAAHKLTHDNLKPFVCKLDNCDKAFTQLGNLKAHQNRFHLQTLNELTRKLAEIDPDDNTMSRDERELLDYFASLYKNSNRGIKGRGKKVADMDGSSTSPVAQVGEMQQQHGQSQQGDANYEFTNAAEFMGNDGKSIAFKNVNYQQ